MSRPPATALVAGLLFPLHERLKGHDSVARLHALERSQWLSPGELESLRVEKLRSFMIAIGRDVPYYRELFRTHAFDPSRIESVAELAILPPLTKSLIRANTEAMTGTSAGPLKRYNTGGSSGEPLIFYMGRDRISHDVAAKWRATRWWGVDIGDREVVVWGSPIELSSQDRMRGLRDRLFRTRLLPAFEMSNTNLDRFVSEILRFRPRMLFGYPSALAHIARHARSKRVAMSEIGIRVAFVTSERLYDDQKSAIVEVFGCPAANGYGGRDAGFIAHECPQGGMHISAEDIIVEILGDDGRPVAPGVSGEVIVTHLATREFPFVRYRTGDVAALDSGPCACGRGLPRLARIDGRSTDFVVAADGTVMHGLALIYVLRDLPGVGEFRIVQHDLRRTEVEVVALPAFDAACERRLVEGFRARLGAGVSVDVRRVDSIPAEASGKHRYVVSRVASAPRSPQVPHTAHAAHTADAARHP